MTKTSNNGLQPDSVDHVWATNRQRLFGLAYRMLGSACDAEDVVQDAYLRLRRTNMAEVKDPAAWLTTVVSRLALNELGSARRRRETYVGPWSPEPVAGGDVGVETAVLAESVSAAFLVVLENLSPAQRVAFVLHDVFGYAYRELAVVLDRSEVACRHLVSRARKLVRGSTPDFAADAERRESVARAFLDACQEGDVGKLVSLLADGATARADGGGKARAARRDVRGADRVARLLAGVVARRDGDAVWFDDVNGAPALGFTDPDGKLCWVLSLSIDSQGLVTAVDVVTNPDKLDHLTVPGCLAAARRRCPGSTGRS